MTIIAPGHDTPVERYKRAVIELVIIGSNNPEQEDHALQELDELWYALTDEEQRQANEELALNEPLDNTPETLGIVDVHVANGAMPRTEPK